MKTPLNIGSRITDVTTVFTFNHRLKQGTDHMSRLEDAMHEMSKPLARYADDTDRDALLKEQEREMDPMLEYMRKKTAKSNSKVKGMCCC